MSTELWHQQLLKFRHRSTWRHAEACQHIFLAHSRWCFPGENRSRQDARSTVVASSRSGLPWQHPIGRPASWKHGVRLWFYGVIAAQGWASSGVSCSYNVAGDSKRTPFSGLSKFYHPLANSSGNQGWRVRRRGEFGWRCHSSVVAGVGRDAS
jgi:hypothetical protein